jgi:hypothetical protein
VVVEVAVVIVVPLLLISDFLLSGRKLVMPDERWYKDHLDSAVDEFEAGYLFGLKAVHNMLSTFLPTYSEGMSFEDAVAGAKAMYVSANNRIRRVQND